ncbi:MAG: dihydrofolate reductase family protein [Actinomycetota bacterium]|nr:dihydrofolate reductase family protein [Actinomycetota bacterium]
MRSIITAMQVSLDGFIEGPGRDVSWVSTWEDPFDVTDEVDACLLGAKMYPGYEQYWSTVLANPTAELELTGRRPTPGEIAYADFAARTPHYVLSTTLDRAAWDNTHIMRSLDEVTELRRRPGKTIHAVGGAALVQSLLNLGLVDDVRLAIHPIVLGAGTPLFRDVERRRLRLQRSDTLPEGVVTLWYTT